MKPEAVEVRVPVYVRLLPEMTAQVPEPLLKSGPVTNEDLADWADALKAALKQANGQLLKIEQRQPKEGTDVAEGR